jgi:uncharacterized protein (DUF1015 family)
MATLSPFAALRPKPDLAARVCELPYDVLTSEEAREIAKGNPLSFFHVSKPEIDLPPGTGLYSPAVYAMARKNFDRLRAEGTLRREARRAFYLYRQVMGRHAQTGIVGVASCREYLNGTVKKHELTRVDKEDDRVRHMEALEAQTGPAFLLHRADAELDALIAAESQRAPETDFVAADGVRHSSWLLPEACTARVEARLGATGAFYIADGHHRSAAAARVCQTRNGAGGSAEFLAVNFPHTQVRILPYHRVVRSLGGQTPASLLERLKTVGRVEPGDGTEPDARREVGVFLDGRWHRLRFHAELEGQGRLEDRLDVALLQRHVLEPMLGIRDPRTDTRIHFVGGLRGPAEVERCAREAGDACGFTHHPVSVEELMAVADAGGIMPPKSTWFEPKLRDGLFCHLL